MSQSKNQMHEHWLSRDYETSARLYLQHWLFQSSLGPLVDGRITKEWRESQTGGKPLRIADIACGNAAWLFDVACDVSDSFETGIEMYGFDIQPSHFPTAACTPPNVRLLKQDVLNDEFPAEFVESFDLVHVRAFSSLIKNNETSPLCRAAMKLLKPGGYLQWEETDMSNINAVIDGEPAPQTAMLMQLLKGQGKATGLTFDWCKVMGQKVEADGFRDAVFEKYPIKVHQGKAWTENYLLAYRDLGEMIPSERDAPGSPVTRESYNKLFACVVEEAGRGMIMHTGQLLAVTAKK